MLALASLTACSKDRPAFETVRNVTVAPIKVEEIHPDVPAPVSIHDIEWEVCGKKLCTTPRHVEQDLESKIDISRWMQQARDTIRFYRKKNVPEPSPVK